MNTTRLILTTILIGSSALATANGLPRTHVPYSAGDLANPAAIEGLHGRLTAAAEQVCTRLQGKELARQRVYRKCVSEALTAAVRDVRSPALAAVHEARTGIAVEVLDPAVRMAGDARPAGTHSR